MRINFLFLLLMVLSGCIARPTVSIPDASEHSLQNTQIIEAIRARAMTGDWLVTRGYHATDSLVANATSTALSHAAIYDAQTETAIEAEGKGVHRSSLSEFVDKSYRLLIIRPRWLNEENSAQVLANAQQLLGKDYDFLGTIGFDSPNKYFCSELAVSVYKDWQRPVEKFPDIIKPIDLFLYGQLIYDSLPRDER